MNFKTIPVAALLGAVSLSSFAIAATDNVDTAAVRGFDTVASRPAADIPPCPYYDDFGPRHHRMLRSPIMAERYGQQVDEIDNIESQLFVERKVLRALERADNANVQEIRKGSPCNRRAEARHCHCFCRWRYDIQVCAAGGKQTRTQADFGVS